MCDALIGVQGFVLVRQGNRGRYVASFVLFPRLAGSKVDTTW